MLVLLGLLLVIWLALIVLGVAVKGLFWLIIVGAVLFAATGVISWARRSAIGRR
ncbi:MAG TPA: hypothetical protein VFG87_27070 [Amycolatopsis sp.]|jgi:hypothetical protein|nr:hypothetical protein [Amycolatopsis sp.]